MKWFILAMVLVVSLLGSSFGNDFNGNRIKRQFGALRPSLGGDSNYDPYRDGNRNPGNNNNNDNGNNRNPGNRNPGNRNPGNRNPGNNNNNNNNNRYPGNNNNNNVNNRYPGIIDIINCVIGGGYNSNSIRCYNNQTPGRGQRPPYRGRYNNNINRNNFNRNGY